MEKRLARRPDPRDTSSVVTRGLLLVAAVGTLAVLAGPGAAKPAAAACRPTLSQGGGPFDARAAPPPRRSRIGRGHVLSGRILRAPDCKPVRGALVEFWQESPNGVYDRRGHAAVVTGPLGTFRFEGPVPPGGTFGPHIHIHVSAAGYDDFVTTYRLGRGEQQGRVTIVLSSLL
jgi:protocatechuate 3,4-dioxygenase beta subunit